MSDLNVVALAGNMIHDPELHHIADNQTPKCEFAVALNGYKEGDVSYVDCTAWGKTAEFVAKFFTKGKKVGVTGKLKQSRWENKEGQKRNKLGITADNVHFVAPKDAPAPTTQEPSPF